MSKKVGRKDPDDPKLRGAQCIFQAGLRKEWTPTCSYWIEIYCCKIGNSKSKAQVFHVYRQWSFMKRLDNEVIDGGINSPPFPSSTTAEQAVVDYLRIRQEKGDILSYMKGHKDWEGIVERVSAEIGSRDKAALKTKIKDRDPTLAEKFKMSQLERQKKADW